MLLIRAGSRLLDRLAGEAHLLTGVMVQPIVRTVASLTRATTLHGLPADDRWRDRLPQPFRRVDKLVAEIIEDALDMAWEREAKAREEAARPKTAVRFIPLRTQPHAAVVHVGCWRSAGCQWVGMWGVADDPRDGLNPKTPELSGLATVPDRRSSLASSTRTWGRLSASPFPKTVRSCSRPSSL